MNAPNVIPILIVTDEHYVIMLAALLKSIEVNHKTGEQIAVYIIADKVSKKSQQNIVASVNPDMFTINWIRMEDAIPAGVKLPLDHTSYPVTIYLRLFIHHIIPKNADKAIFLDVDVIILNEISTLYNLDLNGNVIGAVQDTRLLTFDNPWGGVINYKELGFSPKTKYFNSGLLLIDMCKWAEQKLADKIIECVNNNINYANYPDQYGLNVVLANRWRELDTRWNYFASGDLQDPFAVHFISRKPFYKSYNYNPHYQQLFYQYLKLTKWRNTKPISELPRYFKKFANIWLKVKKKLKIL